MIYLLLEMLFKITGYSTIIFSLWLLIGKPFLSSYIDSTVSNIKRKKRTKKLREMAKQQESEKPVQSMNHLNMLLKSVFKMDSPNAVQSFIFFTLTLLSVSFIFLFIFLSDFVLALISSLLISSLPYVMLRLRLIAIRTRARYSFMKEFHVLLQNYQTNNQDIYYAITTSYKQINDSLLQSILIKLANSMNVQRNPYEFRDAVKTFIYSIDSSFARRFGNLVLNAYLDQRNILDTLVQLNRDIEKRKISMEEEKSKKLDTVMLGISSLFAPIIAFFLTYYLSGIMDFWYYFKLKSNFTLFILCCVASLLSFFTAMILKTPKADI